MKEIEVEAIVEDCTAQLYYDAIYAADAGLRAFHAKVNGDPAAAVGPWNGDGLRTVTFVMPMNVPAMLKKFIGLENVPVVETQKLEWTDASRSAFRVVSEPQLNFPGANKFTTSGYLEVNSLPNRSCQLKATVRCSATMPWPMQATVEGLMATEAVASIRVFLDFCVQFYAAWRAEQRAQPERPAPAPTHGGARPEGAAAAAAAREEQFFDAVEEEGGEGEGEAETSVVPYQPPRLEDIIVDCLRQIQASTTETAATLRSLEELIRNMDDNMQVVRDKLVGRRAPPPRAAAATAATSGATAGTARPACATRATKPTAEPTGASSSYLGFLAAASLVCGAGALVYVRYRLGASGGGGGGGK